MTTLPCALHWQAVNSSGKATVHPIETLKTSAPFTKLLGIVEVSASSVKHGALCFKSCGKYLML